MNEVHGAFGAHLGWPSTPAHIHTSETAPMKNKRRPSSVPHRLGVAIVCSALGGFLMDPAIAGARQIGGSPPPLVVFASKADGGIGGAAAARSVLSGEGAATLEAIRSDPAASAIRIGHSAPTAVLDARALSLALPPAAGVSGAAADAAVAFTGVGVEPGADGLASLYARDEGAESEAALVIQGPDVLGHVRRGAELWRLTPLGGGATAVYRYDTSQLRTHPEGWGQFVRGQGRNEPPHEPDHRDHDTGATAGPVQIAADTGEVIDVMVVYTLGARAAAGNIDAFIQLAFDNTRRIYDNSGIRPRLRLVHKYETGYTEASGLRTDLIFLTNKADGHMDEVHDRRDRYGADLVVLITARNTELTCGVAWLDYTNPALGFSVVAQNCEAGNYTFAHEIGHNQGADHDPDNALVPLFPYGHGNCNTAQGWSTVMAYPRNSYGNCVRRIEYFSSPLATFGGTPTGDAARRDNARVLNETAHRVANYRQSAARDHVLPLVMSASSPGQQGFVRIINRSERPGAVNIRAIDDRGRPAGPLSLALDAKQAVHFTSRDLERGNASKGLFRGVGSGTGHWRLELSTDLDVEALAYVRTEDGFVTAIHEVAAEEEEGSMRYRVPFFNPRSNGAQRSWLRLINPGSGGDAKVTIRGEDDDGEPSDAAVTLTLPVREARSLTAEQLELGGSGFDGRFGDGAGKWRLTVSADRPIEVMSLLRSPTGHITNLSRPGTGRRGSIAPPPPTTTTPPPPPPPSGNRYGALATVLLNPRVDCSHRAWITVNHADRNTAQQAAVERCTRLAGGRTCSLAGWFADQCGALASGFVASTGTCLITTGVGYPESDAERNALAFCRAGGGGNCRLTVGTGGSRFTRCTSSAAGDTGAVESSAVVDFPSPAE